MNDASSMSRSIAHFDWDRRSVFRRKCYNQCMVQLDIIKHLDEGDFNLLVSMMGPVVTKELFAEVPKLYETLTKLNAMDTELYKYSYAVFNRQSFLQ